MASFNPAEYIEVADRIPLFWDAYPDGAITTEIIRLDGPEIIVKATLYRLKGDVLATGIAREVEGRSPVNRTAHAENAETSAIGRALANAGFTGSAKRASKQEMEKVKRQEQEHGEMLDYIKASGEKLADEGLKERIRKEWAAAKQQIKVARQLADAVETALDAQGV